MPTLLLSFKIDADSQVRVLHGFFAPTKREAEAALQAHADACPKFGPAYRADETVEFPIEIDELPDGDGDAIEQWLHEFRLSGDLIDEATEDEEER